MNCDFVLNNTNTCICKTASHGGWMFGYRAPDIEKLNDALDDSNCIMSNNDFYELAVKHKQELNGGELNDCKCDYCTYTRNKKLDKFEECFCCKGRLYVPDNIIKCCECNSTLCKNCFIQGRYNDYENGTFCFQCRKFAVHKNGHYYFASNKYHMSEVDNWEFASWYY